MNLDKSTLDLLSVYKKEEQAEPKPVWFKAASEKVKHFYDKAFDEYQRIIKELEDCDSPDDARKIKNLTISSDHTKAYLNRKGLIETANVGSSITVSRGIINKTKYPDLVACLDNWDASIQARYKIGGKHRTSRSALSKARLEAEKELKKFDIELARELNKSLQESTFLKANNEVKMQNKNLNIENANLAGRIQQLEIQNNSYIKQLAQASTLNKELVKLRNQVAKLTAENALLKSNKGDK